MLSKTNQRRNKTEYPFYFYNRAMPPKGQSLFRNSVLKEVLEFQEKPRERRKKERKRGLILECE